jgi:hypothetical protein
MVTTDISAPASPSQRRGAVHVTAAQMGAIGGVLAVVAGAVFAVRPPEVYGLCMACHARDLVNWTINDLAGTHLTIAPASLVFPVLTTVGVLVGALLGAMLSGEFRWRSVENSLHMFVYGALVMMFALLAGGCAIRLLLRTAAGEALGMSGFGGLIAGVTCGTIWLRWRATR